MSTEDTSTKVYTRCEGCGKIVRPEAGRDLPDGWIDLGISARSNAPRVACSSACQRKVEAADRADR
jgi:hypothetical protein